MEGGGWSSDPPPPTPPCPPALWALLAYAAALRLVAPPVPVLGGLLGLPTMLGVLFLLLVVARGVSCELTRASRTINPLSAVLIFGG